MSNQLPTVEQFRITNRPTVPTSASYDRKRVNILALHKKGFDCLTIARKTYPSQIPSQNAVMISPEGSPTLDSRLMAKWNNYVAFVQAVIDEISNGK